MIAAAIPVRNAIMDACATTARMVAVKSIPKMNRAGVRLSVVAGVCALGSLVEFVRIVTLAGLRVGANVVVIFFFSCIVFIFCRNWGFVG